jgi:hypothetical protein
VLPPEASYLNAHSSQKSTFCDKFTIQPHKKMSNTAKIIMQRIGSINLDKKAHVLETVVVENLSRQLRGEV